MREIKFRVYDRVLGVMYDKVASIVFDDNMNIKEVVVVWNDGIQGDRYLPKRPEDIEIMQSTGEKDKNGVDIYRGDIVSYYYYGCDYRLNKDTFFVIFEDGFFKMKDIKTGFVIFEDGCFKVKDIKTGESECVGKWDELQVIGNIYENEELLK